MYNSLKSVDFIQLTLDDVVREVVRLSKEDLPDGVFQKLKQVKLAILKASYLTNEVNILIEQSMEKTCERY